MELGVWSQETKKAKDSLLNEMICKLEKQFKENQYKISIQNQQIKLLTIANKKLKKYTYIFFSFFKSKIKM